VELYRYLSPKQLLMKLKLKPKFLLHSYCDQRTVYQSTKYNQLKLEA